MAGKLKNLSDYNPEKIPSANLMKFGIVVSEWNPEITNALLNGAHDTLIKYGVAEADLHVVYVPGSFELPLAAAMLLEEQEPDAVICLGCVIQGETRHFEFICQAVANSLIQLGVEYLKPVIFGVLTTNTFEQAKARAGGEHGNKGIEAAISAIKMAAFQKRLYSGNNS